MEIVLEILTLIVCILLILVVLIQDSKGGGLSSSFGASNQILGVRKTTDFLEKATWVFAIGLLVLSLFSAYYMHTSGGTADTSSSSITKQRADAMPGQQPQPGQGQSKPAGTATNPTK
jgi:preprotein translocase subunit SecG